MTYVKLVIIIHGKFYQNPTGNQGQKKQPATSIQTESTSQCAPTQCICGWGRRHYKADKLNKKKPNSTRYVPNFWRIALHNHRQMLKVKTTVTVKAFQTKNRENEQKQWDKKNICIQLSWTESQNCIPDKYMHEHF